MSSPKKITNPITGNKINADGALAKSLVKDGIQFSKQDQKVIKSVSPKSPKKTELYDIPDDVLNSIYNNTNAKYTDIRNMSLASKRLNNVAKHIYEHNNVSFEIEDYYKFIDSIGNRTVDELTMDHKDLLTFYLVSRKHHVLKKFGLFTKESENVSSQFEKLVFSTSEEIGRSNIDNFKNNKSNEQILMEFNKTWEATWSVDFILKFEYLHGRLRFVNKRKPELKLLKILQNQVERFMLGKSTFKEYLKFLKQIPLYERALIMLNYITFVDFSDYHSNYREYEESGLYDYRKLENDTFIRTLPSYNYKKKKWKKMV